MRLFVAIPVSGAAADVLGGLLDRWRGGSWPVKWVRREGLHLTLKFLGSVEAEHHPGLVEVLAGAVRGTPALSFALTELGTFPGLPRPRVLWAGLQGEAALELLVHRIEQATERLGFPLEGRPYRPHVTLGRVREGSRLSPGAIQELESERLPEAAFLSHEVVLYQSITAAEGARYESRATFPLERIP